MWNYEKRLQYPVNIKTPNAKLAQFISSQYGGPDGEIGASMRYLSQRFTAPNRMVAAVLNDVGTEELARKSTAVINACQYSFIFPLSPNDMHDLCRLYEKAGAINESEQDEIINNGRGRAFVVTSPSERSSIDIETPKDIERLFGI